MQETKALISLTSLKKEFLKSFEHIYIAALKILSVKSNIWASQGKFLLVFFFFSITICSVFLFCLAFGVCV